jgi:hypothetical protein
MFRKIQKITVLIILVAMMSVTFLFAAPQPVRAQWVVETPSLTGWEFAKDVLRKIGSTVTQSFTITLLNAVHSFTVKLAKDVAVYVASGGGGQKPLFDGKSFGAYMADTGKETLTRSIVDFSDKTLGKYGFNVCAPNVGLIAKLKIGALGQFNDNLPPPRCDWKQLTDNWSQFGGRISSGEVLKNFGLAFEPGQSELGFALEFNNKLLAQKEGQFMIALNERVANGPWQDVKNIVNGRVETPASIVREYETLATTQIPANDLTTNMQFAGFALQQGAYAVVPTIISAFSNTLLNELMKKAMEGLFKDSSGNAIVDQNDPSAATPAVGRRAAQEIYNDFIKPNFLTQTNYDPLIEFMSCPDKDAERQINNCVIDDRFSEAVRQASQGAPLTIAEAMQQGFLDGKKPFFSSQDAYNTDKNCYQTGYCYSNLVKLRKARIIPVGFELAADLPTKPTLGQVVGGFNNCSATGGRDTNNPYCHLIDPNWVLRMPKMQCNAKVYGSTLISSGANFRAETCADEVSCLAEDGKGNCTGGYGYCTKEKNIWRIAGDECSAQYESCLSYTNRENKTNGYLRNTVNFDSCNAQNTGCRAYSVKQQAGAWSKAMGNAVYLNKNAEVCDANAAGCTELYDKSSGLAYNLLINSSFENYNISGNSAVGTVANWGAGSHTLSINGTNAFEGQAGVRVQGAADRMENSQIIKLELNKPYTVSVYGKAVAAGVNTAEVGVNFFTNSAATAAYNFAANILSTCGNAAGNSISQRTAVGAAGFARISCTFLSPGIDLYAKVFVAGTAGSSVWLDAAQFEENGAVSPYLASGYGSVNSSFLKVAPAYLNCQAGSNDPACGNYAPECRREEVGCALYSPINGGSAIPGIINVNDTCPAVCAGYDTFRQEKTYFESEKFPNYIIPSTARVCTAQENGCDEFTNTTNESKEYFSFMRLCMNPDQAKDAVFYTWEGSDQTGYQLRSHRLQRDVAGNPAVIVGTDPALCTQAIFRASLADPAYNPDCREFYNAAGAVSYRLLTRTIISSPDCSQYRKTTSDAANCAATGGTWDADRLVCFYNGLKSDSVSCSAAANGCRAYSGAASSNLRLVFQDDFEGGANGWTGGTVAPESLTAGGHSYKYASGAFIGKDLSGGVFVGKTYTLSFWAKAPSAAGRLTANFTQTQSAFVAGSNGIDLKGDWRYYSVGPFNVTGIVGAVQLQLTSGGVGFYIDNIVLQEVSQKLYLVKNSWNIPAVCNQSLNGALQPQAMLGCREYKDAGKNSLYLKSFSLLCRDAAVGCKAFQNTNNNKEDKNVIANAICALSGALNTANATRDCQYNGQTVCTVGAKHSACRFTITDGAMPARSFSQSSYKDYAAFETAVAAAAGTGIIARDESTVEVSADKALYLVDDGSKVCQSKDVGCSALGKTQLYSKDAVGAETVYLKNQPDNYGDTLCAAEAEGCESWQSSKGADYFKSPQKLCEYKSDAASVSGWYKQGTTEACYAGFIQSGAYGIMRNADADYAGAVGTCPVSQNACAAFMDPTDTSGVNLKGKPYYLIDNDKIKTLEADCQGKSSIESGCISFNKMSDINLKWRAEATYLQSTQAKTPVAPVSQYGNCEVFDRSGADTMTGAEDYGVDANKICVNNSNCPASGVIAPAQSTAAYTGNCIAVARPVQNTNIILKVTRDRACAEWLSCKTAMAVTDPLTQSDKLVCGEIGLCNEYAQGKNGTDAMNCANYIQNVDAKQLLTADYYAGRRIGWASLEYAGYSMGNRFPATDAEIKNIGSSANKDMRLMVIQPEYDPCVQNPGLCQFGGRPTISPEVIYNFNGQDIRKKLSSAEPATCRGYSEQDSPFPNSVAEYDNGGKFLQADQNFQSANICEFGQNCECDYTKLSYSSGGLKKYTAYGNRDVASGICQGGSRDGQECVPGVSFDEDPKSACGKPEEGGICQKLQRQDDVIGWKGYCLERDLATSVNGDSKQKACLTWFPQDAATGQRDIYNQFRTAGYNPSIGSGKYFCLRAEGSYSSFSRGYDNLLIPRMRPFDLKLATDVFNLGLRVDTISGGASNPSTECEGFVCGGSLSEEGNLAQDLYSESSSVQVVTAIGENHSEAARRTFDLSSGGGTLATDDRPITFTPVYKSDIDLIRVEFIRNGVPSGAEVYPFPRSVFYVKPEQETIDYDGASNNMCDGVKIKTNCRGEKDGEGKGLRDKTERAKSIIEKNDWYFRFVRIDDENNDGVVLPSEHDYLSSDILDSEKVPNLGAYCQEPQWGDRAQRNMATFAIKFHFNPITGRLEALGVASCGASVDLFSAPRLKISIRKRETCEAVGDFAASRNNQPYTNNLWSGNPENKNTGFLSLPYNYNYENQPFGSAASENPPKDASWYSYYTVGINRFAGVPWSCSGVCGTAKVTDGDATTIDFDSKTPINFTGGIQDYFSSLFNKISNVFILNRERTSVGQAYDKIDCAVNPRNPNCFIGVVSKIVAPKIWAPDPTRQFAGNKQYALATAGFNRFSINNELTNDVAAYGDSYLAVARFYAWADTDHGPIKSIKIDWGDGSVFETTDGKYKNHKPFCAPSNAAGANVCQPAGATADDIVCNSQQSCPAAYHSIQNAGTRLYDQVGSSSCSQSPVITFGNSPDACDERYFEFQHIYTFNPDNSKADCNDARCIFHPRISVIDNWDIDNSYKCPTGVSCPSADGSVFGVATGPNIALYPTGLFINMQKVGP